MDSTLDGRVAFESIIDKYGQKLIEELWLAGCDVRVREPLRSHLSFRIGGPVDLFIVPHSTKAFLDCFRLLSAAGVGNRILGAGTNVVPAKEELELVVVSTVGMAHLEFSEADGTLYAGAGVPFKRLCLFALELRLSGLERAFGLPGSVGGAVFMNAGCYGWETAESVVDIEVFDGQRVFWIPANEAHFGYRTSVFKEDRRLVILGARFKMVPGDRERIWNSMRETMRQRLEKQPLEYPSAGSVFKRPKPDFYVGTAIEKLGLKGFRIGGAQVSEKHAGFIINVGDATPEDILQLIDYVKARVREAYGVELETEVEIWN